MGGRSVGRSGLGGQDFSVGGGNLSAGGVGGIGRRYRGVRMARRAKSDHNRGATRVRAGDSSVWIQYAVELLRREWAAWEVVT